jgi:hypothetical protein
MDLSPDHHAQKAKEKEIETLVVAFADEHSPLNASQAKKLIGTFITLTPPLKPPIVLHHMAMARFGEGGTVSRKPGNITLNWRRLFELAPDVTLAGATAAETQAPWLILVAALYIWAKLWKAASIKLDQEDALVVYSLWLHRNSKNRIPEEDAFLKTNELATKHKLPIFDKEKFTRIINKLLSIDCIEINNGVIWLCEWVTIKY